MNDAHKESNDRRDREAAARHGVPVVGHEANAEESFLAGCQWARYDSMPPRLLAGHYRVKVLEAFEFVSPRTGSNFSVVRLVVVESNNPEHETFSLASVSGRGPNPRLDILLPSEVQEAVEAARPKWWPQVSNRVGDTLYCWVKEHTGYSGKVFLLPEFADAPPWPAQDTYRGGTH